MRCLRQEHYEKQRAYRNRAGPDHKYTFQ
jgi:hypothetical protein